MFCIPLFSLMYLFFLALYCLSFDLRLLALYCLSFNLRLFGLVLSVLRLPTFWPCIVCPSTYDFLALYCLSFDFRLFGLVLSVLRLTTTDYTFDIFKLFLHTRIHWCNYHTPWNYQTIPYMYMCMYFPISFIKFYRNVLLLSVNH